LEFFSSKQTGEFGGRNRYRVHCFSPLPTVTPITSSTIRIVRLKTIAAKLIFDASNFEQTSMLGI